MKKHVQPTVHIGKAREITNTQSKTYSAEWKTSRASEAGKFERNIDFDFDEETLSNSPDEFDQKA